MTKKATKRKTEPPSCSKSNQCTTITSVRWKINLCILSHLSKTARRHPQMMIRVVRTKPNAIRRRIRIQILLAAKHISPDRCHSTPIALWFLVVSIPSSSAAVALLQSLSLLRVSDANEEKRWESYSNLKSNPALHWSFLMCFEELRSDCSFASSHIGSSRVFQTSFAMSLIMSRGKMAKSPSPYLAIMKRAARRAAARLR